MNSACGACTSGIFECMANFCLDTVGCAHVTPGGPCSTLEACCMMQGDFEQSCRRRFISSRSSVAIHVRGRDEDWDFNTHIPVPCNYDQ